VFKGIGRDRSGEKIRVWRNL